MPRKRGPKLKTLRDVSTFLGKIIRETYVGDLSSGEAAKLAYVCSVLKSTLEAGDLEKRISELEKQLDDEL